jgi:phosphatidylserine decarboxylase
MMRLKSGSKAVNLLLRDYLVMLTQRKPNALGIFRLAPQDYHRFHIPVDGVMGEPKLIKGEYYTVNPMAIRSA